MNEVILFSVLTLNIWGLPGLNFVGPAPFREQRLKKICQELKRNSDSTSGWDAVLLQEAWLKEDRRFLTQCGYDHSLDLNSDELVIDSGLMILSKYPLSNEQRLTYPPIALDPDVVSEGEALARKSANLVKISHPKLGEVWLGNTHLVSFYGTGETDKYAEARIQQFNAFIDWSLKVVKDSPLVLGGDWNFGPKQSLLWNLKQKLLFGFVVSSEAALFTTLSKNNVFQKEDQDRVDHIYASSHFESGRGRLSMEKKFKFFEKILNVSDHFGWTEVFLMRH